MICITVLALGELTLRRGGGGGPPGGGGREDREAQKEGVGYFCAQGRGLGTQQSQHDDSIQHIAPPPSHTHAHTHHITTIIRLGRTSRIFRRKYSLQIHGIAAAFRGQPAQTAAPSVSSSDRAGEFSRYFPVLLSDEAAPGCS